MQNNGRSGGWLKKYHTDYYAGALMLLTGLGAVYAGLGYHVGTLTNMGPGFFPVSIGVVLAAVGVLIALGARKPAAEEGEAAHPFEWRVWICISLSLVAFIALGKYGGLMPATFAITFISAMGDRENTVKEAALLSVAMCAVAVVVFWWALKMQFPLFTWG